MNSILPNDHNFILSGAQLLVHLDGVNSQYYQLEMKIKNFKESINKEICEKQIKILNLN